MPENKHDTTAGIEINDLSLREKIESMPLKPGVYRFKDNDGTVIYVGKAINLRSRVRQYFLKSRKVDSRITSMISKIKDVEITITDSELEALILEANLIKELKPKYNVVLKDDKSYPYIVITDEPYPRVFVTRKKAPGKSRYFGPYTDVKNMRAALKTVRDVFRIRSCNYDLTENTIAQHKFKLCLDYHIKKCDGPCEGIISREQYNKAISQVALVLHGKYRAVVDILKEEMRRSAEALSYEEAAVYRDKINQLNVYSEKQKVVDDRIIDRDIFAIVARANDACGVIFRVREGKLLGSRHFYFSNADGRDNAELMEYFLERYYVESEDYPDEILLSVTLPTATVFSQWLKQRTNHDVLILIPEKKDDQRLVGLVTINAQYWLDELFLQREKRADIIPHTLAALQRDLRLRSVPRRIECFDISNIQGSDTVASMVVFIDGKPKKSEYRKFRIKTVTGPNDFASMEEVLERRYSKMLQEKSEKPDFIVIDGGKGQLSSALTVLQKLEIDIPLCGLAKRLEEIFIPQHDEPILLPKTSSSLKLLQQIRDEAHRFAVTYHRTLRSKRILQTELDLIKGIGKKKSAELLEAFGSIQGIKFASQEQLSDVVGESLAIHIKEYFSQNEADTSKDNQSEGHDIVDIRPKIR